MGRFGRNTVDCTERHKERIGEEIRNDVGRGRKGKERGGGRKCNERKGKKKINVKRLKERAKNGE